MLFRSYAAVPPPPAATSPPVQANGEREDLRALLREQKRAIEGLEAEKASLAAQLEGFGQVEQSTCSSVSRIHHVRLWRRPCS